MVKGLLGLQSALGTPVTVVETFLYYVGRTVKRTFSLRVSQSTVASAASLKFLSSSQYLPKFTLQS